MLEQINNKTKKMQIADENLPNMSKEKNISNK